MSDDLDKFTLDELSAARKVADENAFSIREVLGLPPDGETANAALAAMKAQTAAERTAAAQAGAAKADSRNETDFLRALDRANASELKPVDGEAFLAAHLRMRTATP